MIMHKYWYFIYELYCPICASSRITRERRYDERPLDYWSRHEIKEAWDYCGAL